MKHLSLVLALLLLASAVAVACLRDHTMIFAASAVALPAHILASGSFTRALRAMVPISVFALALLFLQWIFGQPDVVVIAKTFTIFCLTTSALRCVRWSDLAGGMRPGSRGSTMILFLLFMRHFMSILTVEATRLLHARSRAVPHSYGTWAFRSLVASLGSLIVRVSARAERFYAAMLSKGLTE